MKKRLISKDGFTLAELLIVVAIIAVLVAVSIPIFTRQLEKARESTDMANFRAAKAAVVSAYLLNDGALPSTAWYDVEAGIFVTEKSNVTAYGKGTEIPGLSSEADSSTNLIDGFYDIKGDYHDALIVCVYDEANPSNSVPEKITLKWVRDGETAIGGVFEVDPSKEAFHSN